MSPKKLPKNEGLESKKSSLPTLVSKVTQEMPKISKDLHKKNRKVEEKKGVSKIVYSKSDQKILAMGTLSSTIFIYDTRLR